MIVFLNFAPLRFMGGAEKWMNDTANRIGKYEATSIISVDPTIANYYGQFVLKRKFDDRSEGVKLANNFSLDLKAFTPFSNNWKKARKYFSSARLIYAKFEIIELAIIIYFSGLGGLRKTVAGIHSPFLYNNPKELLGKIHNKIYSSALDIKILSLTLKVHVLNDKDYQTMRGKFNLKNVIFVPNGIDKIDLPDNPVKNKNILKILFVGELSERKGIDILIETIKISDSNFIFTVVGDGSFKEEMSKISIETNNVNYNGYIQNNKMTRIYKNNDVLFMPSRAESFSLVCLESMMFGLTVISSSEINLNLPKFVHKIIPSASPKSYIKAFRDIIEQKRKGKLTNNRKRIHEYTLKNFSYDVISPQLFKQVFEI